MASNVFGEPVTGRTKSERAAKANEDPNKDGKRDQALAYVKKEKEKYGDGVSTLSIFYNATGDTLFYAEDHSKSGKIYDSYPVKVQNGQWGGYLHTKEPVVVASGSEAFVVYRGKYNDTDFCKQLIAWYVPGDQRLFNNHAYCEIYEDNSEIDKDKVYRNTEGGGPLHSTMNKRLAIITSIDEGTSPLYQAHFTFTEVGRHG
uniref:23 kDa jasmonate-induced protein-like n=1 Tax=Erigeron canadensis TaxID=72917 RepID=UPI001CB97812|nr:23 kDa jasmonate-induced protein-like [Erigeron canadensis]